MDISVISNKKYERVDLAAESTVFGGYYKTYTVPEDMLVRMSKDLGFSYELYKTLDKIDPRASHTLVSSMSSQSNHSEVLFLLDEDTKLVIDYSLDVDRPPVLNDEFIRRVTSLAETSDDVSVAEVHYLPDDTVSSILLRRESPVVLEEKYEGKESREVTYYVGVLIFNNEVSNVSTRLVLYSGGQPLYLPSSYYNTTTSRYKKSTSSSLDALEVLTLKVIDDLRDDVLFSKLYEVHYKYRAMSNTLVSYEEYSKLLNAMRRVPSIIEDTEHALEPILSKIEEFEVRYPNLDDKKSSYIWRCTALVDLTIKDLVDVATSIMTGLDAPNMEYFAVRDLLGSYVSTNRVMSEIARGEELSY